MCDVGDDERRRRRLVATHISVANLALKPDVSRVGYEGQHLDDVLLGHFGFLQIKEMCVQHASIRTSVSPAKQPSGLKPIWPKT